MLFFIFLFIRKYFCRIITLGIFVTQHYVNIADSVLLYHLLADNTLPWSKYSDIEDCAMRTPCLINNWKVDEI